MTSSPSRERQCGVAPLTIVIVLAVVILALLVTVNALSAYRTSTALRGWNEVLGSWDEIMQRYPTTEANTAALELERIAQRLGIDIVPRHVERDDRFDDERRSGFDLDHNNAFRTFSKSQMEQVRLGELEPPPPELTAYMAAHDEELVALRRHLNRGEVAVWKSEFSLGEVAPLPNLLGHIKLQKLLAGTALARLHAGDTAGALADLEAAWNLSRSLHDSPILISQLILIAGTRMQLGVLRHVEGVDASLLDRLAKHDFRESFVTAMKYEGWIWLYFDESGTGRESLTYWQQLAFPLFRPYAKLCMADSSDAWRERLVNLDRVDALCDRDLAPYGADLQIALPSWNKFGDLYVPHLVGALGRLARLELDMELTRLLIEACVERRANGGGWPEGPVTTRASESCPDDQWNYSVSDEGLKIALSRDVRWPDQKGAILPTSGVIADLAVAE